jgi:hypothetical protein
LFNGFGDQPDLSGDPGETQLLSFFRRQQRLKCFSPQEAETVMTPPTFLDAFEVRTVLRDKSRAPAGRGL